MKGYQKSVGFDEQIGRVNKIVVLFYSRSTEEKSVTRT